MQERMRQLIDYYGLSVRKFEQKISCPEGSFYKYLSRGGGLNSDTLARILDIFSDISPDWLLLGKGEMLRQNEQKNEQIDLLNVVSLEKYEKKVEECALLKAELRALKEQVADYAKEKAEYSGITTLVGD